MMVRRFNEADLKQIEKIHSQFHEKNFTLPDVSKAYADAVVERDGQILGFGILRTITESIMILDLSLPQREKIETLSQLIKESIMMSQDDSIHSFVENPTFEEVLKKHYGYKSCKGSALYLEK